MAKKLKVGIIGVGAGTGVARLHLPGWKDNPYAELVALCDVNPQFLADRGKDWGVSRLYERVEDLLADKEIDAVDICVPNMWHRSVTVAALDAGKHVMCEKPLAPTADEIHAMIEARDRNKRMLMTAQHFRFDHRALALKAEIDKGVLGDVYHARSWMLRRAAAPCRTSFTLKANSGGGPCIDIGVHILDLTLWMMGHPKPVAVSGVTHARLHKHPQGFSIWGGALPKEWDVEEFAAAMVRFDNGASLVLEVSWLLHHKVPGDKADDMQMWLYGERGGAHWPANDVHTSDYAKQQFLTASFAAGEGGGAHARECVAFAEAVVTGKPSPVPAEQSLHLMGILQGLYQSAEAGREIAVAL